MFKRTQGGLPALLYIPATAYICLTLVGCYGAGPKKPAAITLPQAPAHAKVSYKSRKVTEMEDVEKRAESCPQGMPSGHKSCVVTKYSVREPVTRTHTTMMLGTDPISFAQLIVLSDFERDKKLEELGKYSAYCETAKIPRWVGNGLAIAGVVAIGVSASRGNEVLRNIGYGSLAAGAGGYGVGYFFFGGRQCRKADHLYADLEVSHMTDWLTVLGPNRAREVQAMAERYNQRPRR